jgi:hypothetical protein
MTLSSSNTNKISFTEAQPLLSGQGLRLFVLDPLNTPSTQTGVLLHA